MALILKKDDSVDIDFQGEIRRGTVTRIETVVVEEEPFVRKITVLQDNGFYQELADETYVFDSVTKVV